MSISKETLSKRYPHDVAGCHYRLSQEKVKMPDGFDEVSNYIIKIYVKPGVIKTKNTGTKIELSAHQFANAYARHLLRELEPKQTPTQEIQMEIE